MSRIFMLLMAAFASLSICRAQINTNHLSDSITNPSINAATDSLDMQQMLKNQRRAEFNRSLRLSIPLIAIGTYATLSSKLINKYEIKEERDEHFSGFRTHVDDYMALIPAATVFGLNALGIKGRHDGWNQAVLFAKSELIMEAIVFPTKRWTHEIRPDGSNYQSFPSGHTAQAFVSAEFLRKEYGNTHPWIAVGGYAMATSVGALRMLNNKHWLPDVLAGAGIGILSVNLAYLTHKRDPTFHKRNISLMPTYSGTSAGLYVTCQLGKK